MLRKTLTTAALSAAMLSGTMAAAQSNGISETFEVVMLGYGYFPEVAHAGPEDSVRFYNASDVPMAATALDGSWSTGLVLPGEAFILAVTDETGEVVTRDFDNSVPDVQMLSEGTAAGETVDAVEPVDTTTEQIVAYGRIETEEAAPDFLDDGGSPISDATATATYGAPDVDTDGDGDPDGYDWEAMFRPEPDGQTGYGALDDTQSTQDDAGVSDATTQP
ncbi:MULTISPECIES: hypothetical protein [unclassified Roseivivax]|uniref:hypothetical protein n=1 Tax=Roseivivax sp. GX 12232 TaxID=2900547 RepID=UPI001E4F6976|nr:hypothetical protein [Roseivivax sp. GX 12232]MCE0505177.1 hypothetical protein [Roseivivax sp. GX 12232]